MNARAPVHRRDDFAPVATAIDYLVERFDERPSLEETAAAAGLSPTHFQRVFKEGAGLSPKRFLQALSAAKARSALRAGESVLGAAYEAGLSAPSRLHDLILHSDAMTPGAYRRKGDGLEIHYARTPTPFGRALIGATRKGVCWLSFGGDEDEQRRQMRADWPAAAFSRDEARIEALAGEMFAAFRERAPIGLYVQGTNFQIKVWEALLAIPEGETTTYGAIADRIGRPGAARAVGAAVGANMISLLIPCHRVIRASGAALHYRWGPGRKAALLALEQARRNEDVAA